MDKFKAFLAGSPYRMEEAEQSFWTDYVVNVLPHVLVGWYDNEFKEVWSGNADYYDRVRQRLIGDGEFERECAEADKVFHALELLKDFFENEERIAALGTTAKKPPKGALSTTKETQKPSRAMPVVLEEGDIKEMHISRRERNPELRRACIEHWMATHEGRIACAACDISFGEAYGAVGDGYIEVHHLSPISQTEGVHEVDPKKDLVPLCANCHAMIHRLMVAEKKAPGAGLEGNAALEKLREVVEEHRRPC